MVVEGTAGQPLVPDMPLRTLPCAPVASGVSVVYILFKFSSFMHTSQARLGCEQGYDLQLHAHVACM